jgi:hypothetical protein
LAHVSLSVSVQELTWRGWMPSSGTRLRGGRGNENGPQARQLAGHVAGGTE